MRLKTALELLDSEACNDCELEYYEPGWWCRHEVELVARRAREEALEMAARVCDDDLLKLTAARIRALPTEPAEER